MRFTGSDGDIDLATEHPEFDAWQWVAPTRLPDLIVPFKRPLYIDILAEFHEHCVPGLHLAYPAASPPRLRRSPLASGIAV